MALGQIDIDAVFFANDYKPYPAAKKCTGAPRVMQEAPAAARAVGKSASTCG